MSRQASQTPRADRDSCRQQQCLVQKDLSPGDTVNAIRSRLYYLLSQAFSFPDEKLLASRSELWSLVITLYPDMGISREVLDIELEALEAEYINVFDGHDQKKYCKPYEGQWRESDRARRQWEIKKFYRFFGLGLNGKNNEMPDHIMCELEFMHYLSYRMVEAGLGGDPAHQGENRPEHYLQAQKDFLQRHLSLWLDDFSGLLQEKATIPFYQQLARVCARFVKDDLEWLQEQDGVTE